MKRSKWKELIVTGICHILVFPILIQTTVLQKHYQVQKQVREGTNHSLTAEKAESEQPQTKDKLHDEETLALSKSELIDNEANVTSQTIRKELRRLT